MQQNGDGDGYDKLSLDFDNSYDMGDCKESGLRRKITSKIIWL